MNNIFKPFAIFLLLLPLSFSCLAADQKTNKGNKGMAMMEPMTAAQMEKKVRMKQDHMLKMHDLSDRILAETNADKKEKLMQEQRQLIKGKMQKKRERHQKMMKKHMEGMKK